MLLIIVLSGVLLVSLVAVLYAVSRAMDYDPSWDEDKQEGDDR